MHSGRKSARDTDLSRDPGVLGCEIEVLPTTYLGLSLRPKIKLWKYEVVY